MGAWEGGREEEEGWDVRLRAGSVGSGKEEEEGWGVELGREEEECWALWDQEGRKRRAGVWD